MGYYRVLVGASQLGTTPGLVLRVVIGSDKVVEMEIAL
jgi:hypothetical protein